MARIGILTCSNCTNDLDCSSAGCLRDLNARRGFFARYPAEEPLDVCGINSCAGCPTMGGHEKILRKVSSLVDSGIDALHISYCVTALCPFRNVYERLFNENYPDLTVIWGTHEPYDNQGFQKAIKELLCAPRPNIPSLSKKHRAQS